MNGAETFNSRCLGFSHASLQTGRVGFALRAHWRNLSQILSFLFSGALCRLHVLDCFSDFLSPKKLEEESKLIEAGFEYVRYSEKTK